MKTIAFLCVAVMTAGCIDQQPETGEGIAALTMNGVVAGEGQTTSKERCRVKNDPFDVGRQIRIYRNGVLTGICTTEQWTGHANNDVNFVMNQSGLNDRVNANGADLIDDGSVELANEYDGNSAPAIARPAGDLVDVVNDSTGDLYEYANRQALAKVVYTAPHSFERRTFAQAKATHEANPSRNAIWVPVFDGGAVTQQTFDKFHITSTDISGESFEQLGDVFVANKLAYAVSFHGHGEDDCPDVMVGGGIEESFRVGVAQRINQYLDDANQGGFTAATSSANSDCDMWGTDQDNYVNRIARSDRGLQLEQHGDLRDNATAREAVRAGVQSVYDCLLDLPDFGQWIHSNSYLAPASDTSYGAGACPRYIGQVTALSNGSSTVEGRAATCIPGDETHTDFYEWDSGISAWKRIGGGTIRSQQILGWGICLQMKQIGYQTPVLTTPGTVRAVITSRAPNGTLRPVRMQLIEN